MKKVKSLSESIGKLIRAVTILGVVAVLSSGRALIGEVAAGEVENHFNIKKLYSNNAQGYYAIKSSLVKQIVEEMNFSNINLENNYSLTRSGLGPILIYEEEGSEVVKCSIMWDRDIHVIYKEGRAIVINRDYNASFVINNTCDEEDLAGTLEIESYILPKKAMFKSTILNVQKAFQENIIKLNLGSSLNKEAVFTLDDFGYTVEQANGEVFSKHIGKAVNPHIIFREDAEGTVLYEGLNFGNLDLHTKIDSYIVSSSLFVGESSQNLLRINQTNSKRQELGEMSLSEFLEKLEIPVDSREQPLGQL